MAIYFAMNGWNIKTVYSEVKVKLVVLLTDNTHRCYYVFEGTLNFLNLKTRSMEI